MDVRCRLGRPSRGGLWWHSTRQLALAGEVTSSCRVTAAPSCRPLFNLYQQSMPHSIQSLDTISVSSDGSYDSDEEDRLLEQEWQESLEQLQQLFSIVLLPWLGKWLGRRWSYWGM